MYQIVHQDLVDGCSTPPEVRGPDADGGKNFFAVSGRQGERLQLRLEDGRDWMEDHPRTAKWLITIDNHG